MLNTLGSSIMGCTATGKAPASKCILILILFCCVWRLSAQVPIQNAPQAHPTIPNTWTFSFYPPSLPLYPIANSDPPFCWGFWIFGDGEYAPNALRPYWHKYPLPSTTNPYVPPYSPHTYPPNYATSYNVVGFVMSRKSDPPPPPPPAAPAPPPPQVAIKASAPNTVTSTVAANPYTRPNLIAPNRKILLEHSHGYYAYAGEESVFAISYRPDTSCLIDSSQRVLLFYNSAKTHAASHTANPSPLFTYLNTQVPNYFQGSVATVPAGISIGQFDYLNSSMFGHNFGSVYTWNITRGYVDQVRNGDAVFKLGSKSKGELRIFPAVVTNHAPVTLDYGYALAVLTSRCAVPPYVDSQTIARLNGIFSTVLPMPLSNPIRIGNSWVVDVDTILLKSGEPTDPNRIIISKVCTNDQVFLNLQFCNLDFPPIKATQSRVSFRIIDPNFKWCRILDDKIEYPGGHMLSLKSTRPLNLSPDLPNTARYACADKRLLVDKELLPGECASIDVVLQLKSPNALGMPLLEYLSIHKILEADVTLLPNPGVLTVRNELLKVSQGSKDNPARIELTVSECPYMACPYCFDKKVWILAVLLLLLVVFLAYKIIFRRKREHPDSMDNQSPRKQKSPPTS